MKNELCIVSYSWGIYNDYAPLYAYSILQQYPEYYVKLITPSKFTKKQKESFSILPNQRFEIIENYKGGENKSARWLLPKAIFDNFKYGYIGDIDFIIAKENPSLCNSHIQHCKENSLPYSNKIRPVKNVLKMTGLHFIEVEPYYDRMDSIILDYSKRNLKKIHNETVLYHMVTEAFEKPEGQFRPHHGIHLGLIRINSKMNLYVRWKDYASSVLPLLNTETYEVIKSNMHPKISSQLNKTKEILKGI